MPSIRHFWTVCVILLPVCVVLSKSTIALKRDHSGPALKVLGNLGYSGNISDILATLEEVLGASFGDESPFKSPLLDDLVSLLTDGKSAKEMFAFDGEGQGLPDDEFTKTDSNVENIDGVKIISNASVHWSPNDGRGGTILGLVQSAVVGGGEQVKKCNKAIDCDKDQFCRWSFFGIPRQCHDCVGDAERCSDNDQCCGDTKLCVWGQCKEGAEKGESGTSCRATTNCTEGHCCALVDGYPVCKPLSTEGDVCSVLDVDDMSFLDHLVGLGAPLPCSCPCVEGLHCRAISGAGTVLESFTDEHNCVPSAGNSVDEAADNIVDLVHRVFDEVKEAGNKKDDVQ